MLDLTKEERADLWRALVDGTERYIDDIASRRVAPELNVEAIRAHVTHLDFECAHPPSDVLNFVFNAMLRYQVHTAHPRYFGLFAPAPTAMSVVADALVAAFNPPLGMWNHSPFAIESEEHLVRWFGVMFGYRREDIDGTFTTGGSEANHTALLTALTHVLPGFTQFGLRGLAAQPVLYASCEAHDSIIKAARMVGLGEAAVRRIAVDADFRMNVAALRQAIEADRQAGHVPVAIVASAGTTNAGVIDPLEQLADVAATEHIWLHVDAAWGGAALLVPECREWFAGIDRADSITFDAHKWLSVAMCAGLYLTRHRGILRRTFAVPAPYMSHETDGLGVTDPYAHSMQWSRRFAGLKVLMSLLAAGRGGYEAAIRHQLCMGDLLRSQLESAGWRIVNHTRLPVVCFDDPRTPGSTDYVGAVVRDVVRTGQAWISMTRLAGTTPALRACITNFRTDPDDVSGLVEILGDTRRRVATVTEAQCR